MQSQTQFPTLKWAQRKDRLYITILVVHTKKPSIDIIDNKKLKYSGTDGEKNYSFEIELFDEVLKDESKDNLDARNIFLNLKKKNPGPYWERLTKDTKKNHWIEIDWVYYTEEDEENEGKQPEFNGQDFGDMGEMDEDDVNDEGDLKDDNKKNDDSKNDNSKNDDNKNNENKDKNNEKKSDLSDLDKEEVK